MTEGGGRIQTWLELRRSVLDQDYLSLTELAQRQRRARQTKYAIWLLPVAVLALISQALTDGASSLMIVGVGLICAGAIMSYRVGSVWERRWDELLRIKRSSEGRKQRPD